jgi:K+-sensing histidine kinase KdpD
MSWPVDWRLGRTHSREAVNAEPFALARMAAALDVESTREVPPHDTLNSLRLMVCLCPDAFEPRLITEAACMAARLRTKWYAAYVGSPDAGASRMHTRNADDLHQNIRLAAGLGATIVRIQPTRARDGLFAFARREDITHLMVSEQGQSRWAKLWRPSTADWMLSGMTDTAVLVVPTGVGALDEHRACAFEVERCPPADTGLRSAAGVKRPVQWALALAGTGALFMLHAPAFVCLAASIGLAVWWCRELDQRLQ